MQRLDLDFVRSARGSRRAGWVLLALALGVTGDMAYRFTELKASLDRNEQVVARAQPRRGAPQVGADELAAARDTVARLGLPWARLFGALEGAASEDVALLAIEPDPKNGTVKISGDSKDYLAALTYVMNLSRSDALSHVQLVRHEARQDAVSFQISAAWNEAKQ
jgi:hypothetical protein